MSITSVGWGPELVHSLGACFQLGLSSPRLWQVQDERCANRRSSWGPQDIILGLQPPWEAWAKISRCPKAEVYSVPKKADEPPPAQAAAELPRAPSCMVDTVQPRATGPGMYNMEDRNRQGSFLAPLVTHPKILQIWTQQTTLHFGIQPNVIFSKALLCWNTSKQLKLNNLPRENVQWRGNIKVCTERGLSPPLF